MQLKAFRISLRQLFASLAIRMLIAQQTPSTQSQSITANSTNQSLYSTSNFESFNYIEQIQQNQCFYNRNNSECSPNIDKFQKILEKSSNPYAKFLQCQFINEESQCEGNKFCQWGQIEGEELEQGGYRYECAHDLDELIRSVEECFYDSDREICINQSKNLISSIFGTSTCEKYFSEQFSSNEKQNIKSASKCQVKNQSSQFCEIIRNLNTCLFQDDQTISSLDVNQDSICTDKCMLYDAISGCQSDCLNKFSPIDKSLIDLLLTDTHNIKFQCEKQKNCNIQEKIFWRPPKVTALASILFSDAKLQQEYVNTARCWSLSKNNCENKKFLEKSRQNKAYMHQEFDLQEQIPSTEQVDNSNPVKIKDQHHLVMSVCFIIFLAFLQFVFGLVIYCRHSLRQQAQQNRIDQQQQEQQQSIELIRQQQQQQQQRPYHHFILEEAGSPFITNLPQLLIRLKDFTIRKNQYSELKENKLFTEQTCAICLERLSNDAHIAHVSHADQQLHNIQNRKFSNPSNINPQQIGSTYSVSDTHVQTIHNTDNTYNNMQYNVQQQLDNVDNIENVQVVIDRGETSSFQQKDEEVTQQQILQLNCGHFFHHDCLSEWVVAKEEQVECPTCRAFIFQD